VRCSSDPSTSAGEIGVWAWPWVLIVVLGVAALYLFFRFIRFIRRRRATVRAQSVEAGLDTVTTP
jgi:hypothetical protein